METVFSGAARGGRVFSCKPGSLPALFVQVWAGNGSLPASWAGAAFSHQGSERLWSRASRFQEKTPSLPPYINILGEQTNLHCSEISLGGRPAPLGPAKQGWKKGRERGGGRADPVSRCRFPLKITKRDLFFRAASGWERTLTTQNSFTNGLVLDFSPLGPHIALPEPSAYPELAASSVPQEAGGRLHRRRAALGAWHPEGSRAPGVSDQVKEKDERCHFSQDLGSSLPQSDDANS